MYLILTEVEMHEQFKRDRTVTTSSFRRGVLQAIFYASRVVFVPNKGSEVVLKDRYDLECQPAAYGRIKIQEEHSDE